MRVNLEDQAERIFNVDHSIGLFAGIVQMSAEQGITHWYSFMEPTLMRLLTRFGIYFKPIGPPVKFNGKRQATVAAVDEVLSGIHRERPDVWEIITDSGRVWPLNPRKSSALVG